MKSGRFELPKTSTGQYPLQFCDRNRKLLRQNYHQQSCLERGKTSPISNLLYHLPVQRLRFGTCIHWSVDTMYKFGGMNLRCGRKAPEEVGWQLGFLHGAMVNWKYFGSSEVDRNLNPRSPLHFHPSRETSSVFAVQDLPSSTQIKSSIYGASKIPPRAPVPKQLSVLLNQDVHRNTNQYSRLMFTRTSLEIPMASQTGHGNFIFTPFNSADDY